MNRARPWVDLAALSALASAALVLDPIGHQAPRLPLLAGLVAGAAAGLALAVGVSSLRPRAARPPQRRRPAIGSTLAVAAVLVAVATGEEIVWRWTLLDLVGGIVGTPAALAVATVAFSIAHGRSWQIICLHSLTGLTFGLAYLAGGRLSAAVAAHAAYNVAVLVMERGGRSAVVTAAPPRDHHEAPYSHGAPQ
jgi:membrane protease YdiL (CAAX protease family)